MKERMRFLVCASIAALMLGAAPTGAFIASAHAQVGVAITPDVAPPLLPVYDQPPIPGPGYMWVPGYWAWNGDEYYWVPGYWATPPAVGLYWTPPYWAWTDGTYTFYPGFWAPTVGFYGGIDYGFGYHGSGYAGGYWRGDRFYYNRAVNNFGGVQVTNVYNETVVNNVSVTRVSYNGGAGGMRAQPTAQQLAIAHQHHVAPTGVQREHEMLARNDGDLRAKANGGHPPIAATARPASFHGPGVVAARDARPVNGSEQPHHEEQPRHEAVAPHAQPRPESRGGGTPEPQREMTPPRPSAASRGPQESRPGSAETQRQAAPPPRPQNAPRPMPESRGGTSEPQYPAASAPRPQPSARPPEMRSVPQQRPQEPARAAPPPAPVPHAQPQRPPQEAQGRPQGRPEGHPQPPQRDPHEGQGHGH